MKKRNVFLALAITALVGSSSLVFAAQEEQMAQAHQTDPTAAFRVQPEEEYYIFELDEAVTRTHVYYR
ncbi:MAG: hypothetical protein IIZ39_14055, partial [Blautia sp.]|nr:hypothetical protein [Blautia sp.]